MSEESETHADVEDREAHVVGCSVTGPSHEKNDDPCQDAWAGTQLPNSQFVIAVADGLGSASHSHIGAELAAETAVNQLESVIRDEEITETVLEETFDSAFQSARSALQDKADQEDYSVRDLNTTLLVAAGGPDGVAAAAVGDGGIVRVYRDQFHLFVPREDLEYANRTTPVQSDQWRESYRFRYSEEVDGVAVFSDGLENFAWDGKDSPQDALFEQFFNFVWYTTDEERINTGLGEFLNHERYRSISGDDKTIAIATLDIDYENRAPPPEEDRTDQNHTDNKASATDKTEVSDATTDSNGEADRTGDQSLTKAEVDNGTGGEQPKPADEFEGKFVKVDDESIYLTGHLWSDQSGALYLTRDDTYPVIKVFDPSYRTEPNSLEDALSTMVTNRPRNPHSSYEKKTVFQWPAAIATKYIGDTVVGCAYTDSIPSNRQTLNEFAQEEAPNQSSGSWVFSLFSDSNPKPSNPGSQQYRTAIDLAIAVKTLHNQDTTVSDFDPQSILITDSKLIFAACDRCGLATKSQYLLLSKQTNRYHAAEVAEDSLERYQYTDRLSLAINIYRLLQGGAHPFDPLTRQAQHGGTVTVEQLKEQQLREHIQGTIDRDAVDSTEANRYAEIPHSVRLMFEKCFIDGLDDPKKRPSAREWVEVLTDELE